MVIALQVFISVILKSLPACMPTTIYNPSTMLSFSISATVAVQPTISSVYNFPYYPRSFYL